MPINEYELADIKRNRETKEKIEKAVDMIFDEVNIMGNDKRVQEALLDAINNKHRTNQQSFWGSMFKVMAKYGDQPSHFFDPRNEASGKACKALGEKASEYPIPYI